ncbi:uncharacterized protein LOC120843208 [Ixodes scapularis]|uniref:uncharacterized protein LOC120843208 n=1 Tax=Ixodes scapularis TaxID=6945 RepID=UPI001A9ED482|nr:uncharacterized protein LOC120843208 [Ixodes scapularis]
MSGYECSKFSQCYHIGSHLTNHVQIAHGDPDFNSVCKLEEVDGKTLLNLSVWMIEQLLPAMKLRVKLLKLIEQLKGDIKESLPGPSNVPRASNTAASVWSTEVARMYGHRGCVKRVNCSFNHSEMKHEQKREVGLS